MDNYLDNYMTASQYGALLTGVCNGMLKYSDMSDEDKRILATNMLWCCRMCKMEPSESVIVAVSTILTAKEIKEELTKGLALEEK